MDPSLIKFAENLGPSGLGVTVILILWTLVLRPFMEKMQASHDKREAESATIIARAQGIIEGAIAKNTDMLIRVDQRLREDSRPAFKHDDQDDGN